MREFDVIVVGGGHTGTEAAAVAARRGARTALVSFDPALIGAMSCNPAIGGLGKGHLVREVDAFDGLMARAADAAGIHYRMLNRSKGPAVWGPRVQADRRRYAAAIRHLLANTERLSIVAGEAAALTFERGRVAGITLADNTRLRGRAVVLATGTFLGGRIFRGEDRVEGGRVGERAATTLGRQLRDLDLPMARLKTGTPPRLDGRTINWAMLPEQPSDAELWAMSPMGRGRTLPQLCCAVTRTNGATHDVIRAALHRSPLFTGAIGATGPRYCPSIEDKIHRFDDRDGHQIFLEPEGLDDHQVYPNGISTSLPVETQAAMIRTITGLEQVRITMAGYAVEYDYVDPRALDRQLQVGRMPGLFCAGQLNGTTGYEEAAAQGLVAGANAASHALGTAPLILDRSQSYIGVMIDDLVLQGVTEPYRMLTARAEFRLRLRADNAQARLTPLAIELGCVGPERLAHWRERVTTRAKIDAALAAPLSAAALRARGVEVAIDAGRMPGRDWLRFPAIKPAYLIPELVQDSGAELIEEAVADARYAPYLDRQDAEVMALRADEARLLANDLDYAAVPGLSLEMIERLSAARPATLAAAGRVRGITPAALTAVFLHTQRAA